ncbi:MAG: DUF4266 domain-containing protein [Rubrivivax sp.]|nr:DUF4266 domain-containing protein [Rubrivivax sp.]
MNLPPRCHVQPARHARRATLCLLALLPLLPLAGCSNLGVQPWERDLLAKPAMQLTPSAVEAGVDDHIYFSKEAATGGRGTGGGGCGCN